MPPEGSRANAVIWVVAALVAVFAAVRLTGSHDGGGGPVRVDRAPAAAPEHHQAEIYVHVAGAVRQPGLLKLAEGSRVATAVERAGGPARRADLSGVNLAARLEDGQQVVVPVRGAAPVLGAAPALGAADPGAAAVGGAAPGPAGVPKISLGSATVEQLDQ